MLNSGTQSQIELLRQLPAAVDMKDLDHKFIFWNNEAEKLYGYTTDEIIGQPVRVLYDPAEFERYSLILNRVRAGERLSGYRSMRKNKDGKTIEVALNLSPLENVDGEIIGVAVVSLPTCESIVDVSNALHQQSELLSLLRHDIETRIFGLSRALELFDADLSPGQAEYPALLSSSRKTTAELIDLIENVLLLYGDGELHKGLKFQSVRIYGFLKSLAQKLSIGTFRDLMFDGEEEPEGSISSQTADLIAEVDPVAIERAVKGAISGFKHCDKLSLSISFAQDDYFAIRLVCQNRVLSHEEIEGLLSEQLRSSAGLELASANGFGLLVARRLIEAHGGFIEIKNLENASCAILNLPLLQKRDSKYLTIKRTARSLLS